MFNALDSRIRTLATLRNVILLLFVFVIFSILIFNYGFIPAIIERAQGADILDNTFNYSAEDVYQLFSTYGDEGRRLYLLYLLLFDFVYPVLFALSNSVLLAYILERLFTEVRFFRYLYLMPFVVLLLDYAENIGILTLLLNYPNQLVEFVSVISAITMLKLGVVNLLFVITLMALVAVIVKSAYRRLKRAKRA
ncbi:MAG: hypothetical protein ACPGWR_02850 [Ardenticatenaceae bacterium]